MQYIKPADHHSLRRIVDPAHKQLHVQPISKPLYVVTAMFNPLRFASRYRLFHQFEKHVKDAGAIPVIIELALRDRHHEVTCASNPNHIQLRGESELWYKENLQNVAVQHLPADAEYIAFVDADFHFTRSDWAEETLHMLQHYQVVQMFSHLTYESYDHTPYYTLRGFAYMHCNQETIPKHYGHQGAVGGAWAWRRSALRICQGLYDKCILGSGDWHMAFGLAMREDYHPEMRLKEIPEYVKDIRRWQAKAADLQANIGFVNGHAVHFWHGPLAKRGYLTRPQILIDNLYNPLEDVGYDEQGVLQLSRNKPAFRDAIRAYFRSRDEDHNA